MDEQQQPQYKFPDYCPITRLPILDAFVGPDGFKYERSAFVELVTSAFEAQMPLTSPVTKLPMVCTMEDVRAIEKGRVQSMHSVAMDKMAPTQAANVGAYEALFDTIMPSRYSNDRQELHRAKLTMDGITQSVQVPPSFRCIVLEN